MPTRNPRSPSQYQEEYVSFLERVSNDLSDIEALESADTWMEHVRDFVFGDSGFEGTSAQVDFMNDAFDFVNESLTSGGFRAEISTSRFRDIETGRFVSRTDIKDFLRRIPFFGGLLGGESEI